MRGRTSLNKEFRSIKRQAVRTYAPGDVVIGDWVFFQSEDGHLAVHNLNTGQVAVVIESSEPDPQN